MSYNVIINTKDKKQYNVSVLALYKNISSDYIYQIVSGKTTFDFDYDSSTIEVFITFIMFNEIKNVNDEIIRFGKELQANRFLFRANWFVIGEKMFNELLKLNDQYHFSPSYKYKTEFDVFNPNYFTSEHLMRECYIDYLSRTYGSNYEQFNQDIEHELICNKQTYIQLLIDKIEDENPTLKIADDNKFLDYIVDLRDNLPVDELLKSRTKDCLISHFK